jgi:antitoxin FitA
VASITIRNLDERVKRKLRLRAVQRNRSMEDEARDILRTALAQEPTQHGNLADAIRRRIEPLGVSICRSRRAARCATRPTLHDHSGYKRPLRDVATNAVSRR